MNEQVARNVVLVRAIETADTKREVLSDDDRMYASRSARELAQWQAADSKAAMTADHFLEQRSEQVLKRLGERTPAFTAFIKRHGGLRALSVALPLLALLAGAGLDRIADPHRVDLLSAPLLAIIAWNLVVYLVLLVWACMPSRRTSWAGPGMLRRLAIGKAALPRKLPSALAAGATQFMQEWSTLSARLTQARLARTMHLAAAAFALGAIASLYARGLLSEYVVGWESTFLDAAQVHALLSILFAPALLLFPLQGFAPADIEALRFGQTLAFDGGGARWVHLYAATLLLLVVLPRAVLALVAHLRAARLRRHFPLDLDQPYFRKLAGLAGTGEPAVLRVLPYSFTVDEARDRGLNAVAAMAFGEQARVMLRPAFAYGEEAKDALRDTRLDDASVSTTAVLFSMAATPEKENHGAFLDYLVRQAPRGVAVLVDESALTERGGSQDARLAERTALWRQFCGFHGTSATIVNLLEPGKYPLDESTGLAVSEVR